MPLRTEVVETWRNGALVSSRIVEVDVPQTQVNEETIRDRAAVAIGSNRTFLALTSPTAAQNSAQVRALTRQVNGLIRLAISQLDETE